MNPVTAGGAPWYASGVHMWNGTAATLNEKPTRRNAIEASWSGVVVTDWVAIRLAMRSKRVLPVSPYVSAIPYRKNALENAPSRKYLNAASAETGESRRMPVST